MNVRPPSEREPGNGRSGGHLEAEDTDAAALARSPEAQTQMLVVDGDYLARAAPAESRHGALGSLAKRVVARLIRFHTHEQDAVNERQREEMARLQARLTILEAATRQRFTRTDAEIAGLRGDLSDAASDFGRIAERVRVFENVRRIVERLGPFRRQVRAQRAEQIALRQQFAALSARLTFALRESAPLRKEIGSLRSDLEGAAARFATLEASLRDAAAGAERSQQAVEALRRSQREGIELVGEIHQRLDATVEALRREQTALSGAITDQAMLLASMTDELGRLTSAVQHLEPRRILLAEAELSAQRERLDALAAEVAEVTARLANVPDAGRLVDAESRMADIAGAFNSISDDFARQEKQFDRLIEVMRGEGAPANVQRDVASIATGLHTAAQRRVTDVVARVEELAAALNHLQSRLTATPYLSAPIADWSLQRTSTAEDFDYLGFEDVFRGPEELVRDRLRAYVPLLKGHAPVVELGSGRGEFLELMRTAKIKATGVDNNRHAVERCRKKGLKNVVTGDANEYLASLAEASVGAVFSAQFAEHVSFTELLKVLTLSRSRLVPGGIFVAETVNPNSIEGAKTFFVDQSHVKPIFPEVFAFLCRSTGFAAVRVFYPNGGGFDESDPTSQHEYAVVATA
jgi:Methyltransferase domain